MKSRPQKQLSIAVPRELHQHLKELSRENGRSLSGYVRQILKRYFRHVAEEGEEGWWTVGR